MTDPHPPASSWLKKLVRSPNDQYRYEDGLWLVVKLQEKGDQIRFWLHKGGRMVWSAWQFNYWKAD